MVIFADALSVFNKLQIPARKISDKPNPAVDSSTVRNPRNEQADRLAREGGQLDQEDCYTSYGDEETTMKTLSKKRWKLQHPNFNQSDSFHKPNTPEQVILFRLRTGHNRPIAHMCSKLKVGEFEMRPCNADIITAEHLLQHCQLHDALRRDMRPEPKPLTDKLYGNLEEPRRTAAFLRAIGIPAYRTRKKNFVIHSM